MRDNNMSKCSESYSKVLTTRSAFVHFSMPSNKYGGNRASFGDVYMRRFYTPINYSPCQPYLYEVMVTI